MQQLFCSITQVADDISSRLLTSYQPDRFTSIDMGKIVVLSSNSLGKLLTCCVVLWEFINVSMPLISETVP
ncbi:MAG TPA: hypothetical protein VED37_01385 [Ktedonobacteraceae bacterium]|nr:hypothetical protein [Ktedonobacteraceae bacterium]